VTDKKQKNSYHFIFKLVSLVHREMSPLVCGSGGAAAVESVYACHISVRYGKLRKALANWRRWSYRRRKVWQPIYKRVVW